MSSKFDALSSGGGPSEHISDKLLPKMNDADSESQITQVATGSESQASKDQGGKSSSIVPVKPLQDGGVNTSQLDKEGSISSITPGKTAQTPGRSSNGLHSGFEGRALVMREKVSEDGYHWRKYGQKLVRGNVFIRSYYRCTHPSCPVKKQLECSYEGNIVDIVYFGDHDHPKPEVNVPASVGCVLSVVEFEKPLQTTAKENTAPPSIETLNSSQISSVASSECAKEVPLKLSKGSNDDPESKRQKKINCNADHIPEDKPIGKSRVVVKSLSEVDIVNDGYKWRKYGQKMVKGNPNPRSYYRCTSPGCPAKKHVERESHDQKMVVTSYEGQHNHEIAPPVTVTAKPFAPSIPPSSIQSGDSITRLCIDLVGPDILRREGKLQDQRDGKSGSKLKGNGVTGADGVPSAPGSENKPDGQQNRKSKAKTENKSAVAVSLSSVSAAKSQEKENGAACSVHTIKPKEQHVSGAGPVTS